ncbi:MAG TPA: Uma2 family endonuclease [Bryobacteraceae bacterium]|jgi:Uma2 family endonuclease
MAARADALLMTVERFRELPDLPGARQELHWGQVVNVAFPKATHANLQYRLVELLRPIVQEQGMVQHELAFRAVPQYDLRSADVGFVTRERWKAAVDGDDNLRGSPELVIEVLSPSNTKAEMREKAALCLSTGCEEFWLIDPHRKTINVTRQDGDYTLYGIGDRIPLARFNADLAVDAIFAF